MSAPLPQKSKKGVLWIVLSIIGFALLMSAQRECQQEHLAQLQAERANTTTGVWMPSPSGDRIFYADVVILDSGHDYVKFRSKDGQIIEQHGSFTIQTSPRSEP